ncbi:MAG: HEPN domain-containing protein [Firmicutes bacterium]|nr:HEPN domain-containing protein [Bacillota bacterium]
MNEYERDIYCNECIMKATKAHEEAEALLRKNDLPKCLRKNYESVFLAIKGLLATDDYLTEDDAAAERFFRQKYIDNGLMSDELSEILVRLDEAYDEVQRGCEPEISKPECGYFTAKAKLFLEEAEDILVAKNARFMGQ